jgi:hypothetical protein
LAQLFQNFGISGGGVETPKHPPWVRQWDKALAEVVKELNIPDLPPFFNRVPRSILWNRVKQCRLSVQFNVIDSIALINQIDPCKRALNDIQAYNTSHADKHVARACI